MAGELSPREMIGTKLLMENDKVRIWELALAPGERSTLHQHDNDYIVVQVYGDKVAVEPHPDTKSIYKNFQEEPVIPGRALYVGKGGLEVAYNSGNAPYLELIVELKE